MHASSHHYMLRGLVSQKPPSFFHNVCIKSFRSHRLQAYSKGLNVDFISGFDNLTGISIVYIKEPKAVLQ